MRLNSACKMQTLFSLDVRVVTQKVVMAKEHACPYLRTKIGKQAITQKCFMLHEGAEGWVHVYVRKHGGLDGLAICIGLGRVLGQAIR